MAATTGALKLDVKVIGLVAVAHFFSHLFQLALPMLFPLIHQQEDMSFASLGFLSTVMFVVSGGFQAPAGFLVDRVGARTVLVGGLALQAGAIALLGFAESYPVMVLLAALAGLGNSIFHPADYSILSATVSDDRIGRAYSMHGIGGFGGYGVAPALMYALGTSVGWRAALIAVGLFGLAVAFLIHTQRGDLRSGAADEKTGAEEKSDLGADIRILLKAPVVLCFLFFMLTAMGQVGMMTLGPSALIEMLGIPLSIANGVVTALLSGIVIGVLIGGVIADRHDRHDLVTGVCVTIAAMFYVAVPFAGLQGAAILAAFAFAGVFYGITGPARDMVVRSISTVDSRGKVFGFIYSGLDFGSAVVAVLFGGLIDSGHAPWVFVLMATFMLLSVVCILASQFLARRAIASR